VTDDRPMLEGLFRTSDLVDVCRDVLNLDGEKQDDIRVFECQNAAIKGSLLMETRIAENCAEIHRRAEG